MESAVKPAFCSSAESAMLKQPACAAPISSSGFVPGPFSKRVPKEYWVSLRTLLSVEIVPRPDFRSPRQTAEALRFIGAGWERLLNTDPPKTQGSKYPSPDAPAPSLPLRPRVRCVQ